MLKKCNFLCEIGTEEIPAGYLPPALKEIKKIFSIRLEEERISFSDIEVYATPRRISLLISKMAETQEEKKIDLKGPSLKAAYDNDKNPTKALLGFIQGNKITAKDIFIEETDKGQYVFAKKVLLAKKTIVLLPSLIEELITRLSFPKRMKWSDKEINFPRPISYLLVLFNDKVVPFEINGLRSSNKTRGHYIQSEKMISIKKIEDYEKVLKEHKVIVDQEKRKELIRKKLVRAAQKKNLVLREDEDLLQTVNFLVENPQVVVCEFKKDFLRIPSLALIAEMREHQKYFSLFDQQDNLSSSFLVVSNNPKTSLIKKGNEKVISARFNDAQFFYEEDQRLKLIERVESLKKITFHKDLGSIYDKVERMTSLASLLSQALNLSEEIKEDINRALLLCKADLNTAMVIEFPSLQGKIGKIYALENKEKKEVAEAIENHYRPNFNGDLLPTEIVSIIVSLAEKIDNIFASFSVGNIPKGSQDPYALRRQAHALVEILIINKINLSLKDLLKKGASLYQRGNELVDELVKFISARAKTIFLDNNFKHDEIEACFSIGETDFFELYKRAQSINKFRKEEGFLEMLISFKRMNNILSAFWKKNEGYSFSFKEENLQELEEKELYLFFKNKQEQIFKYIQAGEYLNLFSLLIQSKPLIDSFFNKILVMDENISLRDNRLSLLEKILQNFTNLLDFSKLSE